MQKWRIEYWMPTDNPTGGHWSIMANLEVWDKSFAEALWLAYKHEYPSIKTRLLQQQPLIWKDYNDPSV